MLHVGRVTSKLALRYPAILAPRPWHAPMIQLVDFIRHAPHQALCYVLVSKKIASLNRVIDVRLLVIAFLLI